MLFDGIFLPLTTPFQRDGRLFLARLHANVDRYSRTPAAGLLMLAPQGEPLALTDAEAIEVLETAIEVAAPEKVLIADVSRQSVVATLWLAASAASLGYDAVCVRVPDAGATRLFFEMVADRVTLPLLLVSDANSQLALELAAELARHPNIVGIIDYQGSAERVAVLRQSTAHITRDVKVTSTFQAVTRRMLQQVAGNGALISASALKEGTAAMLASSAPPALKTRLKKTGFQLLCAETSQLLACWQAGAVGGVPAIGACVPQACAEVYQAFRDGDAALAEEKQARITQASAAFLGDASLSALKYGCDLNAYFGGSARLPLLPLTSEQRHRVEQALDGMRN